MLRAFYKFYGAVESEVKTSADGLTTLFYEKQIESSSDEESTSEDSSFTGYRRDPIKDENERISRTALLNRGYCLCVVACTMILSVFGIIGLLLNGEAVGIGSCLVGFLIAMTLEIVSLVRFIMFVPFEDGTDG
jgi:hypothetical protein